MISKNQEKYMVTGLNKRISEMNEKYKVSIITVVYNGVRTIERTIQSVLNQTYKNIEYIIIDGMSTDGTQQIVAKYESDIACFISEKDEGLYYAMNKGIEKATGDIIGIINSDDWYHENAVEKIVDYFLCHEVDLVYGKIEFVYSNSEKRVNRFLPLEDIWYRMVIPHPSVFIRKNIYQKHGWFNTKYRLSADYELILRLYSEKVKFGYLDSIIAFFSAGGLSGIMCKESGDEDYAISKQYIEQCPDKKRFLPLIEERQNWNLFLWIITKQPTKLYEMLCDHFHKKIENMMIFGTGFWGEQCFQRLADNKVKISCFIDNDASKWGTKFQGVQIISPTEIQNMDSHMLIAVQEGGEKIKEQLESMGYHKEKCVYIKELQMRFGANGRKAAVCANENIR